MSILIRLSVKISAYLKEHLKLVKKFDDLYRKNIIKEHRNFAFLFA